MLKTGRKTTWEEIEVGEVFVWEGCWCICIKLSDSEAQVIETGVKLGYLEDGKVIK